MEFLIAIVLFGVMLAFIIFGNIRMKKEIKAAETTLKCKCKGTTLYIDEQSELFSIVLTIREHKVSEYKKDPLEVHIGSATVGGITTGGVYTTGGGIAQTDHRSDKFELIYKHVQGNEIQFATDISEYAIEEIVLSDELAKKAKNSKIKEYLINGNTIEVVKSVDTTLSTKLYAAGHNLNAISVYNWEKLAGYPTKVKCEKILNWLCGK